MNEITPQAVTDAFTIYRAWGDEIAPTAGLSTQDLRMLLRWQIEGIKSGAEDDEAGAKFQGYADSLGLGAAARRSLFKEIDATSFDFVDAPTAVVVGVLIGLLLTRTPA